MDEALVVPEGPFSIFVWRWKHIGEEQSDVRAVLVEVVREGVQKRRPSEGSRPRSLR